MSVITLPSSVVASMGQQGFGQLRYDLRETSDATGASATRVQGPPRWKTSLASKQAMNFADAGQWEALALRLRGGVNYLAVHDIARTQPLGSVRGPCVLNAGVAIGDTSMVLKGMTSSKNLLAKPRTFNDAAWTGTAPVTADSTVAPSGTTTGDTITDSDATAVRNKSQTITVPNDSARYTVSCYLKKTSGGTSATVFIDAAFSGGSALTPSIQFNTDTGAILTSANISGSGTDGTDPNWWRVSFDCDNNATGDTSMRFLVQPARAPNGTTGNSNAQTGSCVIWGASIAPFDTNWTAQTPFAWATVEPGDWLQIGTGVGASQLVKVIASAVSADDDTLTVAFEPPLRYAFSTGAAVTWDKPVGYYKLINDATYWNVNPNGPAIEGFALDLLEQWG